MTTFEIGLEEAVVLRALDQTCFEWSWAAFSADECGWLDASYGYR